MQFIEDWFTFSPNQLATVLRIVGAHGLAAMPQEVDFEKSEFRLVRRCTGKLPVLAIATVLRLTHISGLELALIVPNQQGIQLGHKPYVVTRRPSTIEQGNISHMMAWCVAGQVVEMYTKALLWAEPVLNKVATSAMPIIKPLTLSGVPAN